MKLQRIFDQLTYGELSQLSIGGEGAGVINEDNWDRVLAHINLGLTAIFKRFMLKENRLTLELQDDQVTYELLSKYAVTGRGSSGVTRYILDSTSAKFKDDILKIEKVMTEEDEVLFPLNDESNQYSMFTPAMTTLRVPKALVDGSGEMPDEYQTDNLVLVYRANHPIISQGLGYFDPEQYEVELPESHLEPLLWFVASRAHNPVGMQNEFHMGNSYYAKYEAACQLLEMVNITVDQSSHNTRLRRNGWV